MTSTPICPSPQQSTPSFHSSKRKHYMLEQEKQNNYAKLKYSQENIPNNQPKFKSMAELVKDALNRDTIPSNYDPTHLTKPDPFKFKLDERVRQEIQNKTSEDIKYEEYMSMPKFKAREFDPLVFKEPHPLKKSSSLTTFREFKLSNSCHKTRLNEPSKKSSNFKASPLNTKILESPDFVYQRKKEICTEIKPFEFFTEKRKRKSLSQDAHNYTSNFKATPMPDMNKAFKVKPVPSATIEAKPFNLLTQIRSEYKKSIHEDEELRRQNSIDQVPKFIPKIVPNYEKEWNRQEKAKELYQKALTIPKEFHLITDERGIRKVKEFEEEKAKIINQYKEEFKAIEMPSYRPAEVKKITQPTTIPESPKLHSTVRAEERALAFSKLEEKRREEKEKKETDEKWRLQLEKQLAKISSFRASPMPDLKMRPIVFEHKPPTIPLSPKLETDKRCEK